MLSCYYWNEFVQVVEEDDGGFGPEFWIWCSVAEEPLWAEFEANSLSRSPIAKQEYCWKSPTGTLKCLWNDDLQGKPNHIYSEVSTTEFSGAYLPGKQG